MAMVSNRHHASSSSTASGVLQDRSVEAFGEPAVDRRKEIARFGALAFVAPEVLGSEVVKFEEIAKESSRKTPFAGVCWRRSVRSQGVRSDRHFIPR
jgi:hypothetical protein